MTRRNIQNALARAFNEGSDSCLAGLKPCDNPYKDGGLPALYEKWRQGWWHIQLNWCASVNGRWPAGAPRPCAAGRRAK